MANLLVSQSVLLSVDAGDEMLFSRILDVHPGEKLVIETPVRQGAPVFLPKHTALVLEVFRFDRVEYYATHALESPENPAQCVLAWPKNAPCVERRKHPRLPVGLPMSARWMDGERYCAFPGWTVNLGRGGLCLYLPRLLQEGTEVVVLLNLPGVRPLEVRTRVLRSGANQGMEEWEFWAGVEFQDLEPSVAQIIQALVGQR